MVDMSIILYNCFAFGASFMTLPNALKNADRKFNCSCNGQKKSSRVPFFYHCDYF